MPQSRIERVWTRDIRIPVVEGDDELLCGWTCIPTPPPGDGWVICDLSRERKTRWERVVRLDS
jgi:hypothetical protein